MTAPTQDEIRQMVTRLNSIAAGLDDLGVWPHTVRAAADLLDALLAQEPVAWRFPPDVSHEDDGWYIVDGANRPSGNRLWQPLYALHIVEDQ